MRLLSVTSIETLSPKTIILEALQAHRAEENYNTRHT